MYGLHKKLYDACLVQKKSGQEKHICFLKPFFSHRLNPLIRHEKKTGRRGMRHGRGINRPPQVDIPLVRL